MGVVMPLLAAVHLLIGIGFAVHAMKTGRPQFWMYVLILVPVVGSLAYVLFELVPELANTRRVRQVSGGIGDILNPDGEWKRRLATAELVDSVDAKRSLGEECERKSMWVDAIKLYQTAATGVFSDDPALLFGLARAHLGGGDPASAQSILDKMREAHPDLNHQEAHLIYARALEVQGKTEAAVIEYQALNDYYAGLEARARFGLLQFSLAIQPAPVRCSRALSARVTPNLQS